MLRFVAILVVSILIVATTVFGVGPQMSTAQNLSAKPTLRDTSNKGSDSAKLSTAIESADTLSDTSRVQARIQQLNVIGRSISDTLLVTLQANTRTVGGFDLKIALVSPYLRIVNILKGELLDSCRWEYFSAKELPVQFQAGRPRSIWQAVALAQTISDPKKPQCFGLNREASILKIVVSNSHVLQMPETTAALFFWWEDCTDNVLSGPSGSQLYMSLNVLDYYPVDLQDIEGVFPNHQGALRQCVNPRSVNKPKRVVSFHNGGVEWRAGVVPGDSRGGK